MALHDALMSEFDREMAITRRLIERFPDGHASWTPHPKSMPLGRLASHVAQLSGWIPQILETDELDFMPVGGPAWQPLILDTRIAILELLDRGTADSHQALARAEDARLMEPWKLLAAGRVLFEGPRVGALRGLVISHIIHHRGQLSVYLRLLDVPLPGIYGPSADES